MDTIEWLQDEMGSIEIQRPAAMEARAAMNEGSLDDLRDVTPDLKLFHCFTGS